MKLSRQVSLLTCGAVAGAVVLSGGLGLALVQHAYDAQSQDVLHREAVLLSRVVVPGRARPVAGSWPAPGYVSSGCSPTGGSWAGCTRTPRM